MSDTGVSGDGFGPFGVTRRDDGRIVVLAVTGALDIVTAAEFGEQLRAAVDGGPAAVIVDLTDLDFLASAGMAALVEGRRAAADTTALVVVADGPATARPLAITGLTEVIPVHPTLSDAVTQLGA